MTSRNAYVSTDRGPGIRVSELSVAAAGATGDQTATVAGADSGGWVAHMVVLKPAATVISATVTATGVNKTYDGSTAAAVALTSANFAPGDSVSAVYTTATFDKNKNVGAGKTVSVSGISLTGADAAKYTLVNTTASTTATIFQRPITVTAVADTKDYDGNIASVAVPVLSAGTPLAIGDTGTWSQAFSTAAAGTGKTLTPSGTVKDLADANTLANYLITFTPVSTGVINKAPLTVTGAFAFNKFYDGTTDAEVNFTIATLDGVIAPDVVDLDAAAYVADFDTKNAGNGKAVTVTGVVLTGADSGNYSVTQPAGLTADISPLDITGAFTAENKVYDGNTDATVATRSLVGTLTGDVVTLDGGAAQFRHLRRRHRQDRHASWAPRSAAPTRTTTT